MIINNKKRSSTFPRQWYTSSLLLSMSTWTLSLTRKCVNPFIHPSDGLSLLDSVISISTTYHHHDSRESSVFDRNSFRKGKKTMVMMMMRTSSEVMKLDNSTTDEVGEDNESARKVRWVDTLYATPPLILILERDKLYEKWCLHIAGERNDCVTGQCLQICFSIR